MSDPSVTVAETLKQFSQATISVLRAYEQGTRARINQAEDDLRALRHERDGALRDLNACKEQTRSKIVDVERWKAEVDRVLVVNQHQAELLAQLRQEAQQWKDQCLRLEETLRGEIKAWKDQFLRVDAERTRLLDQLSSAPSSSQTSQTTLASRTPKRVPTLGGDASLTSSATTKRGVSASASASSSTTARADNKHRPHPAHSPTKAGPLLPRLVRRVQAVIEVPVKEEPEGEDGEGLLDPADIERPDPAVPRRTSAPAGTAVGVGDGGTGGSHRRGARRRKFSASASASASASSHRRSLVAPPDEEGYVDGEEPPSDEAEDGEYVDEEEVADAIADGTPPSAVGRKAVPWGRKHIRHEPDEEDDELMMYAKDNPHKVHPLRENHPPQPPRLKSITDVATPRVSATNASAQKRKTMEMGSGCMMRTKRRR